MIRIPVYVTSAHINAPIFEKKMPDGESCMMALALYDAGFSDVEIGFDDSLIDGEEVAMPGGLAFLARHFDLGNVERLAPFQFDVLLLDGVVVGLSEPYSEDCDGLIGAIEVMLTEERVVRQ